MSAVRFILSFWGLPAISHAKTIIIHGLYVRFFLFSTVKHQFAVLNYCLLKFLFTDPDLRHIPSATL